MLHTITGVDATPEILLDIDKLNEGASLDESVSPLANEYDSQALILDMLRDVKVIITCDIYDNYLLLSRCIHLGCDGTL